MTVAALDSGLAIALVVFALVAAAGVVYAGLEGALGRWREQVAKPRRRPAEEREDREPGEG